MSEAPRLQRAIRLPHATALVVGTIVGASIFTQPSEIAREVSSGTEVCLVWLTAGILTLAGSLVCAELASIFTRTGGVYVYLREAFAPAAGFLWGWAMFWTMHSGIVAVLAVVAARYAGTFVPLGELGRSAVAIGAIMVLSAVNYVGVRHGSVLQTLFTAGKLLAVGAIIIVGLTLAPDAVPEQTTANQHTPQGFLVAVGAALFAFGGWHMVTYNSEETHDPKRTIPRSLMWGVLIVTACYIGMNAAYLRVLPLQQVATTDQVAADLADTLLGSNGEKIMGALVVFSTLGALTGIILAGPRVYYALARDGLLFRWLGEVHPRFQTPHRAIVMQAIWASVLVGTNSYGELFSRVIYTEWLFFAALAVAIFVLRRRGVPRGYSVLGYPVVPAVFAAVSLAVVAATIARDPWQAAEGLGLVLVGLPVFWFTRRGTPDSEAAS